MNVILMALTCAALLAGCGAQSSNTGAISNVGNSPKFVSAPIGATNSSTMLIERIKQPDSGSR